MRIQFDVHANAATLAALLEGLTRLNMWLLAKYSPLPPIYESGVRYQKEPRGREDWATAPKVYARRHGDCEDLACWRAAELRLEGETSARAIAVRPTNRTRMWHAVVQRADGTIEDPSKALGMKGAA